MAATNTETSTEAPTPPERDFEWGEPHEIEGATFIPNVDRAYFPPADNITYLGSHVIGYVVEGVEDLIDKFGERELEIPPTYSSMDEFSGFIGQASAKGAKFGTGVDAARLEAGIRVATGGGRYSTNDLTAIGCAHDGIGLIVRGPDGDFLLAPTSVPSFGDERTHAYDTYEVAGMEVPEADRQVRKGIEALVEVLPDALGTTIIEHKALDRGRHYFQTESGEMVDVTGNDLTKLAGIETTETSILGGAEFDVPRTPFEFQTEVTEADLEYSLGAEHEIFDKQVVGLRTNWSTDRGPVYSRSSKLRYAKLEIEYVMIAVEDGGRIRVSDTSSTVQKFEP